MAFTTLKNGSKGDMVKAMQYIVGVTADGKFGAKTEEAVKALQKKYGLTADGLAGKKTFEAIVEHAPTLRFGNSGAYVFALEVLLADMKLDGIYTQEEVAHVRAYQASKDLVIDGIVGKKTWSALFGLDEKSESGSESGKVDPKQPVVYRQYDKKWKKQLFTRNNTYNKKQNIGNSGCGITCMAMIIATWWDKSVTPVETAKECVAKGYRTKNSGTDPGYFSFCAKKYNASKYIPTKSYATAKNFVDQGGLVIVNVGPSIFTKNGHYILWWKQDGKDVYINDPASAAANRNKSTESILKKASKGFYCFLR